MRYNDHHHTESFTIVLPRIPVVEVKLYPIHLTLCSDVTRKRSDYTLSHPENDRDVTERVQGYTLQNASFIMHQSRCSFLNA